ncbi:MAG: hypothetical protein ACRDSH_19730 [Pseudonocardiaceae bacterium]
MLRTLADPNTPITHDTLNRLSPWRSVAYLRDLLMHHGVLPPADRHLTLFQRWLGDTLADADRPEHRQVVERFAAWHVQRRLHRFADRGPVTTKQTQQAEPRSGWPSHSWPGWANEAADWALADRLTSMPGTPVPTPPAV